MSPIKIARRNRNLCLIKAMHNKRNFRLGLQHFYYALLIIMHIQVVHLSELQRKLIFNWFRIDF